MCCMQARSAFTAGLKAVLWTFLVGLFSLCLVPLLILLPWGLALLAVPGVLLGGVWTLMLRIWRGPVPVLGCWLKHGVLATMWLTILHVLPMVFLMVYGQLRPVEMPRVDMRSGDRAVLYQGMVHVADAGFYRKVGLDMLDALEGGYVLFLEGVSGGTPEEQRRLSALMGVGGLELDRLYDVIAGVCGLSFQSDALVQILGAGSLKPGQIVQADVTVPDMLRAWDEGVAVHPEWRTWDRQGHQSAAVLSPSQMGRALEKLNAWAEGSSPRQRWLASALCKGALSWQTRQPLPEDNPFFTHIVVGLRNEALAEKVLQHPGLRIYIAYGTAHLEGFYEALKKRGDWQVRDVRWFRAMGPDEVSPAGIPAPNDNAPPACGGVFRAPAPDSRTGQQPHSEDPCQAPPAAGTG
jgi:hypothetical protein